MELNWTSEAIVEILVAILIFIGVFLIYFEPKTKKIKSLVFIQVGISFIGAFFALDAFGILFLNIVIGKIAGLMFFPSAIFTAIGINYVIKETYNSIFLIIGSSFGILLCFLAFLPDAVIIEYVNGEMTINWSGYFLLIGDFYQLLPLLLLFYWVFRTWLSAPFPIKKEATIFLIGTILGSPIALVFYLFNFWDKIFLLISDLTGALGLLIFCISIIREPKLLYVLPFKVYRILVKDRKGFPLFDHDWSKSNINEKIFTGFVNAVQVMSEEVMNIGGLLDINLKEGILILHESESITVGLVSSKTSLLLKESIINFTKDFEILFQRELKESCSDMKKFESAYTLIDKYFSNFPSRVISSKKHPLLLTGKYVAIPLELDNKLKNYIQDEKEYEFIKAEIQKSPLYLTEDFISLYNELKDELNRISENEKQYLDKESNNES